jgi:ER membrane protein SH3
MSAFITAGAGFLLAVLWFDLMFDVQVLAHRSSQQLPDAALESIARYYARVTTAARPMNRLIAAVMVATLAAIVVQIARADPPRWIGWASLVLALPAIALAGARIVPDAVRLGTRHDTPARQSQLARSIFLGHVLCWLAFAGVLVVQLGFG